jgi:DNA helicase-2/ATP-dependent DNA helicase PcrA
MSEQATVKMNEYLAKLNREQRAAVEHGIGEGKNCRPLLVIAGAGTGKTNTLTHRVAHLIVNGCEPSRILLLTFTRRAANTMGRRANAITAAVLGQGRIELTWSGTFHSIGARLLRRYARRISLQPSFTILDRSDAADVKDLVRHDLGQAKKSSRFPRKETCLAIYSATVNAQRDLHHTIARHFPWCDEWEQELRTLFASYVKAKHQQNVLDFDDLLLCWAAMMNDDQIAREIGSMFDHVLVDEYQDTNRLQADILLKLKPHGRGLMVVGDDAQSIFSFRTGPPKFATFSIFPTSSTRPLASSSLSKIIGRPSRF